MANSHSGREAPSGGRVRYGRDTRVRRGFAGVCEGLPGSTNHRSRSAAPSRRDTSLEGSRTSAVSESPHWWASGRSVTSGGCSSRSIMTSRPAKIGRNVRALATRLSWPARVFLRIRFRAASAARPSSQSSARAGTCNSPRSNGAPRWAPRQSQRSRASRRGARRPARPRAPGICLDRGTRGSGRARRRPPRPRPAAPSATPCDAVEVPAARSRSKFIAVVRMFPVRKRIKGVWVRL